MLIRTPEQDIERVLFTEKTIAARVEQLGAELTARLGGKRPVLVCVLKGASFFYIDLCRSMNCAIDMDFIAVSSYGQNAKSTGVVRLIKDLDNNITGRDVVIVEELRPDHEISQGAVCRAQARIDHNDLLPRQGRRAPQRIQDRPLRL